MDTIRETNSKNIYKEIKIFYCNKRSFFITTKPYDGISKNLLFLYMETEDYLIPSPVNTLFTFQVLVNGARMYASVSTEEEMVFAAKLLNELKTCKKKMLLYENLI